MTLQPTLTLPSDDEPWWATVFEFQNRLNDLIRTQDWRSGLKLASKYFERATHAYEAAVYARARACMLDFMGRHDAAHEAEQIAEHLVPVEPDFKISIARRLIADLNRPEEGLAKLDEAKPLLGPNDGGGWLNERAIGLLALGRDSEAVECLRAIASPPMLKQLRQSNDVALFDFRLVAAYLKKRLALDVCVAYVEAAETVAEHHNPDRLDYVRSLLREARQAGA